MMEETKKSKSLRLLTVLLSVAAVAAMLWCAPYFKDDWAWGSQVGLDRLQSHFTGYNGRYLGNLLVMVLTRSLPVKIILMTAGVLALPLLVSRLANKKLFFIVPTEPTGCSCDARRSVPPNGGVGQRFFQLYAAGAAHPVLSAAGMGSVG